MTPKEKAQQLIYSFEAFTDEENEFEFAKDCALIAVDEILNEYWSHNTKRRDWWKEVRQEIINN